MKRVVYNSPVILNFTLLSMAVLALNFLTKGLTNQLFFSVYRGSLTDPLFYFRLVGHVLGHQSFEHFAGNFMYILLVGDVYKRQANMVRCGVGAALSFDLDMAFDDLRFLPLSPAMETGTVLVWKKDQALTPAAEAFHRHIDHALQAFLARENKH